MALLQNISLINQYPVRHGSYHGTNERSMWGVKSENNLNRYAGMASLYAGDAIPRGYYFPYTWAPSRFAGGMSSYGWTSGVGTIAPPNLAGGKNLILLNGQITGTCTVVSNILADAWIRADYPQILGVGSLTPPDLAGGKYIVATITGLGELASFLTGLGSIRGDIAGVGTVYSANLAAGRYIVASLAGLGGLTGDLVGTQVLLAVASLYGSSSMSGDLIGDGFIGSSLSGLGVIVPPNLAGGLWAIADLSGLGNFSGLLTGRGDIQSALAGVGAVSEADIKALANASALLEGLGQVSWADIAGGMHISANLVGSSLVVSYLTGAGWMTATINIGAKPSASDIASTVWSALASAFDIPGTMGKKLNDAGSAGDPWSTLKAPYNDPATFGGLVKKLLTLAKYLGLKD